MSLTLTFFLFKGVLMKWGGEKGCGGGGGGGGEGGGGFIGEGGAS